MENFYSNKSKAGKKIGFGKMQRGASNTQLLLNNQQNSPFDNSSLSRQYFPKLVSVSKESSAPDLHLSKMPLKYGQSMDNRAMKSQLFDGSRLTSNQITN